MQFERKPLLFPRGDVRLLSQSRFSVGRFGPGPLQAGSLTVIARPQLLRLLRRIHLDPHLVHLQRVLPELFRRAHLHTQQQPAVDLKK